MFTLNTRPIKSAKTTGRLLENEAVIVLPEQAQVKVLNAVGARIWDLVDGQRTAGEIALQLAQEFAVDLETAEQDTLVFLNQLAERTIIHAGA